MDISQYVSRLAEDLVSAASAGDEQTQRIAARLGTAIEPAARLAVMNALADLAAEVTAALGDRTVDVRLDGRDVRVVVSPDSPPDPHPQAEPQPDRGPRPGFRGFGPGGDAGDISRITLRLVEQIKGQAEQAAAAQGVSLNSWVASAVQGALSGHAPDSARGGRRADHEGRRLRGWVQG